jgi:hypothetical protein
MTRANWCASQSAFRPYPIKHLSSTSVLLTLVPRHPQAHPSHPRLPAHMFELPRYPRLAVYIHTLKTACNGLFTPRSSSPHFTLTPFLSYALRTRTEITISSLSSPHYPSLWNASFQLSCKMHLQASNWESLPMSEAFWDKLS